MPHISKRLVKPEIETQLNKSFIHLIKSLDNTDDVNKFFNCILSQTERIMIAKRVCAAFLIKHNVNSHDICDLLKLTPDTVFKIKLRIQVYKDDFDKLFEKLEMLKRNNDLKVILYNILNYAIVAGSGRVPGLFNKRSRPKRPSIY